MTLPERIVGQLAERADLAYPFEACGLLVGTRDQVVDVYWAANHLAAIDRFEMDPQAILDAERSARRRGLRLVGFWHSHPDAPPEPSDADRTEPGAAIYTCSSGSIL
ncbi:MAG: M67 family metallopeptidase [Acidobacteriota bacterium]